MSIRIAAFAAGALATAVLVLPPTSTSAAPAPAADVKSYSAAGCAPFNYRTAPIKYLHYGMYNDDLYSVYPTEVICPIVKDVEDSTPEIQMSVYFNALMAKAPFSCTLWAMSADGWTMQYQTKSDDSRTSQGKMDFAIAGFVGGYYQFHCQLPPLGYLVSYSVKEL